MFRLPYIHTAVDYNDNTVPTSAAVLQEYANYVRSRGDKPFKRNLRPTVLRGLCSISSGPTIQAYEAVSFPWVDTAHGAMNFGCLKVFIDSPTSESLSAGQPLVYEVEVTLTVEFANLK